jgi:hypothetical protein
MKRLIFVIISAIFIFFLNACCGDGSSPEEKAQIIAEYKDSIAVAEKIRQDSINSLIPDIKVNLYIRKDIFYDSEGWPVESGKVVKIKDFQKKKEYLLVNSNGYYQRLDKIEFVGTSENITLQVIDGETKKIIHEDKDISINGIKTYANTDPSGNHQKYHQDWFKINSYNLMLKVLYKQNIIFEGKISLSE